MVVHLRLSRQVGHLVREPLMAQVSGQWTGRVGEVEESREERGMIL